MAFGAELAFGTDSVVYVARVWPRAGSGARGSCLKIVYPEMVNSQERAWPPQSGEGAGLRTGFGEGGRNHRRA